MIRKCKKCNKNKYIEEFVKDIRIKNKPKYKHICSKCLNIRQKETRIPERSKKYNERAYIKIRNNPDKWKLFLKRGLEYYHKNGRKKYIYKCIVCNNIFRSVRRKVKFCSGKCQSSGKYNSNWQGGKIIAGGYILIYSPTHPSSLNNYMAEHRLVMEKHIKRLLLSEEQVHHINFNKKDNRIENLMLFSNASKHTEYHRKINRDELGNLIIEPKGSGPLPF